MGGGRGRPPGGAVPRPSSAVPVERPLVRRLRQAGVDPDGGLAVNARKPEWLRVQARMGGDYLQLGRTIHDLGLVTVCEEAGCPNIYECWADGTATFMVNGSRCTRACGFCLVDTRHPLPLDPGEPARVAEAVERMGLAHAVVTCVARDDLADGGAGAMADTIRAIRRRRPGTSVEVLISDCKGDGESLARIFEARPDVLNHNIETVARLQRAVRPSAGYARSLAVLARAADAGLVVKSGLMVGLGEREDEVVATLADLRSVGVSIATIGQYLRPSAGHLPVARWWTPEELDRLGAIGRDLGLAHVEASPLTRSSYHAKGAAVAAGAVRGERGRADRCRSEPSRSPCPPGGVPDVRARAARLVEHGQPLRVEEVDLVGPSADEVVVTMQYAGVNPVDRYGALGRTAPDGPVPRTLGVEGVGTVDGRTVVLHGGGLGTTRDGLWATAAGPPAGPDRRPGRGGTAGGGHRGGGRSDGLADGDRVGGGDRRRPGPGPGGQRRGREHGRLGGPRSVGRRSGGSPAARTRSGGSRPRGRTRWSSGRPTAYRTTWPTSDRRWSSTPWGVGSPGRPCRLWPLTAGWSCSGPRPGRRGPCPSSSSTGRA